MNDNLSKNDFIDFKQSNDIVSDLKYIIETSQKRAYQAVNEALIYRNWLIGYRISEETLKGEDRAECGAEVIKTLSKELNKLYGKGFERTMLYRCNKFYKCFPEIVATAWQQSGSLLSWSHYRVLIQVEDKEARDWYAKEALSES